MKKNSAILGAAFLMATSAIGPGFLTQTSLFTGQLLTSFGFVILVSVLLDIGAQLNIWRIVTVSNRRAQDIANEVRPGLGYVLAALIAFGGLVFNIGNIAGCSLGLSILAGADLATGAIGSALIALGIFWYREAGRLMDGFTKLLGIVMILVTAWIAITARPPLALAAYHTVWPEKIDVTMIVTLVGGTVGGYISFAGAHRLLDAGISGTHNLKQVNRSAVSGILITSFMRFILFLAALGVVWQGTKLSPANPAASVFRSAAGELGYRFFGVVLWSAAITSVVGASYTTVSFWKTLVPFVQRKEKLVTTLFIAVSTVIFVMVASPAKLLVLAGAVNGLVLPVALALMLLAVNKRFIADYYKHPVALQVLGWVVVAVMSWMGAVVIRDSWAKF